VIGYHPSVLAPAKQQTVGRASVQRQKDRPREVLVLRQFCAQVAGSIEKISNSVVPKPIIRLASRQQAALRPAWRVLCDITSLLLLVANKCDNVLYIFPRVGRRSTQQAVAG
jgi:hypothetical protein